MHYFNKKFLWRFLFVYFFIQTVPLDWKFYRELFSIDWSSLSFYDLFSLTRYMPQFFQLSGYENWLAAALIALIAALIWPY